MPSSRSDREAKKNHRRRGSRYEQKAETYFTLKGFTIIERNWQAGHKEIDLIARKESLIVFIEVKSSASDSHGHPAEKVTENKIRNLTAAARRYLEEKNIEDCDLRFDLITFLKGRLEHFPDAFPAME